MRITSSFISSSDAAAWRGFGGTAALAAALVFTVLYGGAVLLDPYGTGRFTPLATAAVRDQGPRTANAFRARDPGFEGAVIGNSHIQLVAPASLAASTGLPFVSLIVPATGPREQLAILDTFLASRVRPLRALVFGIDDRWCTAEEEPPLTNPFPFWLYAADARSYLGGLLRWPTLEAIVERLRGTARRKPARPDGFWDYEAYRTWREEEVLPRLAKPEPPLVVNADGPHPLLERLGRRLAGLPAGAAVVLVRPPVYATALPAPGSPAERSDERCRDALIAAAAARPGVAILDRRRDDDLARDPRNFFDHTHYRRVVAERLEGEIAAALLERGPDAKR
ncbi:MAG: hypothetical protein JO048_01630 [Methylobacteriaceae bacterium]|nr:hypothetical protein [Methylobacteriaceae bacterium]